MFVLGKCFQSASAHRRSTLCPVNIIHNPLWSLVNRCMWPCFKQGVIQVSLPKVVKILLKANVSPAGQHLIMLCTCLSTLDWKNEQDRLIRGIYDYQGNTLGKMCTREVTSRLDKIREWCAHGWSFMGRSLLTWRLGSFQKLIRISLKSMTRVMNYFPVLLMSFSWDISSWLVLICKGSMDWVLPPSKRSCSEWPITVAYRRVQIHQDNSAAALFCSTAVSNCSLTLPLCVFRDALESLLYCLDVD